MAVPSSGHGEVIPHTYPFILIGQRVREIRDAKNLGQTDIERASHCLKSLRTPLSDPLRLNHNSSKRSDPRNKELYLPTAVSLCKSSRMHSYKKRCAEACYFQLSATRMSSEMERKRRPLRRPASRMCGNARMLREASEMPSCRMTIAPGTRFFSISQRMYHTGGCAGS